MKKSIVDEWARFCRNPCFDGVAAAAPASDLEMTVSPAVAFAPANLIVRAIIEADHRTGR